MKLPPLALQPIIFGARNKEDPEGVCAAIAAAGFTAVESGPREGETTTAFANRLLRHGLRQAAIHTALAGWPKVDDLLRSIEATGARDICNSGIFKWGQVTKQDYEMSIVALNYLGSRLRRDGVHLHYHNHAFEFEKVDGDRTGMDLLLAGLDPACVTFCLDVAWVLRGGQDPVATLEKFGSAVGYVHLKDWDGQEWRPLGKGNVDIPGVLKQIATMPSVRWCACEQDKPDGDPAECVAMSRRYLAGLGY